MATITATVDLTTTPPRVSVSLAGWAADGPVTVQRVHADTSIHTIYMPDVSGGVSQAYDYWPTTVEACTYQAMDGAILVQSAAVTVGDDGAWLVPAGMPDTATRIQATRTPAVAESRPIALMESPFRAYPKGEYGVASAGTFELELMTRSAAEFTALRAALRSSGKALIRLPYSDLPWQWCLVTRWPREPVVHYRRQDPMVTDSVADWRTWTLSCVVTGDPDAAPFGDPTASHQALVNSGKTYQQVLDWKTVGGTPYLEVLKGGF